MLDCLCQRWGSPPSVILDEDASVVMRLMNVLAMDQEGKSGSLTLRLREMGGLIRSAGDVVVNEGGDLIEAPHIKKAVKIARTAEEQIKERYGSFEGGLSKDLTQAQRSAAPYQYWNYHESEDERYIG